MLKVKEVKISNVSRLLQVGDLGFELGQSETGLSWNQ